MKKDMTVYVVNYKETTIGEDNVMDVDSGICDFGYLDEAEAIKKVQELADEAHDECIDELGYEEDDIEIEVNDNGDMQTVNCGSNTYEYWVSNLGVI